MNKEKVLSFNHNTYKYEQLWCQIWQELKDAEEKSKNIKGLVGE